ncbi:MAG: ABC transporter ATP-binding protein [Candidatus Yanofskybacteria bacterium CG10_big_fil_rev_8_21_14_0_10_37_15]|uniref:ABC transporter ATP-binding protein n=1 Tax=Candidatus Yanofskybacteria bacterium CG10_big_fil_rev_8_21_14_0_10_37_15 TaxID=1975097 RepID=A0A2H0R5J9_9BACT|nr:MAG: ABC transporter ATP-binding protein [Candidatus Yanofskybacteria bacterium CG10_big_fil_rev_8_21_14_0_10_37_15]
MSDTQIVLKVENLGVKFEENEVLKDLVFSVRRGDVLAIIGPNGSGKSVMFRALLNIIPYSGKINWLKGLKISYVPQKLNIDKELPLSVLEFFKIKSKNKEKIINVLNSVGIVNDNYEQGHLSRHLLNQRLGWLSGGQLQRILIAWAVIDDPDVLLFDEPTAGIDIGGEETIYNLLRKFNKEKNMTILLISHDLNVVYKYANNVICLNKKMICFGVPEEVLDPSALTNLYGGEAGFYKHGHHEHSDHNREN